METLIQQIQTAANWIENTDALVIHAGAGMGVDSGLADYRGDDGQWGSVESANDKPIFEVVNPKNFLEDPAYSWKLFGQRIQEYANTAPHYGFQLLLQWIQKYKLDYFVLTSNIDSHFQKAGFEESNIRELHGSLAYFQSSEPKLSDKIWRNELSGQEIIANASKNKFPICPYSGVMARPNVYMFRDNTYISTRSDQQKEAFQEFLSRNDGKNIVVIEIGSGPHVQSIRMKTRELKTNHGAKIIRINPKDYKIKAPHIGIAQGGLAALTAINEAMG